VRDSLDLEGEEVRFQKKDAARGSVPITRKKWEEKRRKGESRTF